MTVQEHDQCHGCSVRITLSVCQDLRNIKHLKATDNRCDQCVCKDRADHWQCNIEKSLNSIASIQVSSLIDLHTYTHNCRHQHDRCISKPHHKVHKSDQSSCSQNRTQEINRCFQNTQGQQNRVDRTIDREHRKE